MPRRKARPIREWVAHQQFHVRTQERVQEGRCMSPICVLIVVLDHLSLGIPIYAVERVVMAAEITPLADSPRAVAGVINVHGEIIPVVDLRVRFRLPTRPLRPDDYFVIARIGARALALVVDEAAYVEEYEGDALLPAAQILPWLERILGVVRLQDGLLIVKDPERFLDVDDWNALEDMAEEGA